jgi:small subunit ribosomal protein S21
MAGIIAALNVAFQAARGARPSWGFAPGDQCSWALPFAFRTARDEVVMLPDSLACGRAGSRSEAAFMQIIVRDNNIDQALRALKKKLQREGVYREMKLRRHYEKPSERRARERAAAIRRARKLERKRAEREGVK